MRADTADLRNSNHHRPSDTPETLGSDFMAEVTRLLIHPVLSGVGEAGRLTDWSPRIHPPPTSVSPWDFEVGARRL